MKKRTAILLILALLLCGCGASEPAEQGVTDLMEEIPASVTCLAEMPDKSVEAADFAVALFQNTAQEGKNTLLSPLSVLSALAMTANGADGETLTQMENTMGMTVEDLNAYLYAYMDGQTDQLKLANSIWFTNDAGFAPEQSFLQTNGNYFQADLYKAPMNDDTRDAINDWVNEKTDGMIPTILDQVPEDAVMYLVNALAFEAEWPEVYLETSVREQTFTKEDGTEQTVELMFSTESNYIEDDFATGFVKYYKDGQYAFVALLPNEGVSVSDYVASLSGGSLQEMLRNAQDITVDAAIPKFAVEYSVEMADVLKAMGMTDAFSVENADFSRMGTCEDGNLYIGRVLHKTHITVAEQGTRAGAATVVEMLCGSAYIPERKEVVLDRPFVYMLVDRQENLPFFIGTLMDVES